MGELPASSMSQPVVARFAIVLRSAPKRSDPTAVLETMQGGVERAVFHLQHGVGTVLDYVGDGMAVSWAKHESLENEQIKRALEEIGLQRRSATFCHLQVLYSHR